MKSSITVGWKQSHHICMPAELHTGMDQGMFAYLTSTVSDWHAVSRFWECAVQSWESANSWIAWNTYTFTYRFIQEDLAVTVKLPTHTHIELCTMACLLSLYARQHARALTEQGASVNETMECLHKEGMFPCCQTVFASSGGITPNTVPLNHCKVMVSQWN